MQQVKEKGKNSRDQTNEEEMGSLPEKEFTEMIVKMNQNLRNRINKMEAQIKKIQKMFNKDLQGLSQSVSSVTLLSLTLCDPMDCSTPGLPVHHQLLEFTQTHVHWVGDVIQPSHLLRCMKLKTNNHWWTAQQLK